MDQQKLGSLEVPGETQLVFSKGITAAQIEEIIYHANHDESVRKFTHDPDRFADKSAFERWLKKGRSLYTLSDASGTLAGVIWFGEKEMPSKPFTESVVREQYGLTFSIRLYGVWRGKHLARPFTTMAFAAYRQSAEYFQVAHKGMWLITSAENVPAIAAYERFGFHQVSTPDEHNEIVMILKSYQGVVEHIA